MIGVAQVDGLPGEELDVAKTPGHWLLACADSLLRYNRPPANFIENESEPLLDADKGSRSNAV